MQTAETDWTLSSTHALVAIVAAISGMTIGAAGVVWRFAAREIGINNRFVAIEKRVGDGEKTLDKMGGDVSTLRDRVGALATRDEMREQFALVLSQLGNIQARVDRLHDRRAED